VAACPENCPPPPEMGMDNYLSTHKVWGVSPITSRRDLQSVQTAEANSAPPFNDVPRQKAGSIRQPG